MKPTPISQKEVDNIMQQMRAGVEKPRPKVLFEVGAARVTYNDNSVPPNSKSSEWTFVVGPFTSDTKFIEAEDFNYSNEDLSSPGQHANFGDPDCSLLGKEATEDIDYHEGNNGNAQAVYRGPTGVEAGKLGTDSYVRGNNTVTCSYIVGWNDAGDWYNYTRDFGASKRYNVYARLSSGGAAENAELALITTDPTAPDQEKTPLGQFNSPATGNWDLFHTIPLRDGQGNLASFRLSGEQTLRFTTLPGNLDVNWLALVPADIQIVGPSVTTLTPPNGTMADFGDPTLVSAVVQDGDTAVVPGSLKLTLDGVDVTATSTITDTATGAMIEYQLAGAVKGSVHTTRVDFKDTTGAAGSGSWSWTSSPYSLDNLFIEAEDFNTDGGNYFPSKGGVPFNEKSLYNTLGAVTDVDFHDNGNSEADNYRNGEVPNLGIADISSDQNVRGAGPRPGFTTTPDYKIGWNDAGEWRNYTRTFPPGNYYVYARLSSGGSDEHAHLDMVADATIVGPQALTRLGRFDAPATGGWDTMAFVPLKDNGGNLASVSLAGEKTLRFTVDPGNLDVNYLMLCPVPAAAPHMTIEYIPPRAGFPLGGVTVTWTGGGVLQVSDNVNGPWTTVVGATSPVTAAIDRAKRFARILR